MTNNEEKTMNEVNETEVKKEKSAFWQKTTEFGKKAADGIQKGAKIVADKTKEEIHAQRLRKYNPLFLKEFKSKDFGISDVIVIEDDKDVQSIDVCEGAIGWRETVDGVEVLHLSDDWVKKTDKEFIPSVMCHEIYCVDAFDRSRYIKADLIFKKAHEERLAELKRIAHALGAKSCTIEIAESSKISNRKKLSADVYDETASAKAESSSKQSSRQSGKIVANFDGSDNPQRPALKWFTYDDNINNLINMRCSNKNSIKYEVLELSGSSSATMSKKIAVALDGLLKIKGNFSMESESVKEHSSSLIYEVEF